MSFPNQERGELDEIDKAALKAIKATNLCMKHMKYHGRKYSDCTPQERIMVKVSHPTSPEIRKGISLNLAQRKRKPPHNPTKPKGEKQL